MREIDADIAAVQRDRDRIDSAIDNIGRTALILLGPRRRAGAAASRSPSTCAYGRELRVPYDREYEQEPPSDLAPALVAPLLRQGTSVGAQEFTATLFDLIRRGVLEGRAGADRALQAAGAGQARRRRPRALGRHRTQELTPWEKKVAEVVDDCLERRASTRLSLFKDHIDDDRVTNSARFTSFKESVESDIKQRRWYLTQGRLAAGLAIAAFAVAAGLLLWIGIQGFRGPAPRWGADILPVALGICAAVNAAALIVFVIRRDLSVRRKRATQEEALRWDAFRRYLRDFPRLHEAPPATLELWERFLVYGIALGLATRVLQAAQLHLPAEMVAQSNLYWHGVERGHQRRARRPSPSPTSARASPRRCRPRRRAGAEASAAVAEAEAAEAAAAPGSGRAEYGAARRCS